MPENEGSIGVMSVLLVAEVVASTLAVPVKSKRRVHGVPSEALEQDQTRNRIVAVPVFDAVIVVSNSQRPL
jgi:hypothetical protein